MSYPKRSVRRATLAAALGLIAGLVPATALANWTSLPGAVQLGSTAAYSQVSTAPDGSGGLLVVWCDSLGVGVAQPRRVQHLDMLGNALWSPGGLVVFPGTAITYAYPSPDFFGFDVCSDNVGGAYVAWGDYEDYAFGFIGNRVWLTHLDSSGATTSGFPVLLNTDNESSNPALAPDGAGGIVVSWLRGDFGPCSSFPSSTTATLLAQRVDVTGHALWSSGGVQVSPFNALFGAAWFLFPPLSALPTNLRDPAELRAACSGGGAYFTFPTFDPNCSPMLLKMQRLNMATGQLTFNPSGFVVYTASSNSPFAYAAATPDSDCLVATFERGQAAYVKRITAAGSILWSVKLTSANPLANGSAISDGQSGLWVSWSEGGSGGLYVQDVGPTATLKLPVSGLEQGTMLGSFDPPDYPPSVVPDGKGGAIVATPCNPGAASSGR
jgi:hypothetical protein